MVANLQNHNPIDQDAAALDFVSNRIAERYGHPARTAYLYLFRLRPGSNLDALIPTSDNVLIAWMDEGSGLIPTLISDAITRCQMTLALKPDLTRPGKLTTQQRRQLMARSVLFIVQRSAVDLIEVDLRSRAISFTPKGDRAAHELWRPSGEGWYSAYQPKAE